MQWEIQALLDVIPASIGCVRARDAVLVMANSRLMHTFQLDHRDIGSISAYDLIAPEHEGKFRLDHDGDHGRNVGDEAEQFRVFKRRDDTTFIGWSRNVMVDLPDGERAAMSIIFEYYDEDADNELTAAYYGFQQSSARHQLARHISQELNSSLHQIGLVVTDPAMPHELRERLQRSLIRANLLGERLIRVGLLDQEAQEEILAAHRRLTPTRVIDATEGVIDSLKILVVEDDEDLAEMLVQVLQRDGHHVDVAHSITDAQASIDSSTPDCVLLDLVLGEEDGRTLARQLEQLPSAPPVVFMTAFAYAAALADATSRYPLLRKPFDITELRAMIMKAVTP